MKIFKHSVTHLDLIPPIIIKAWRKFVPSGQGANRASSRVHPFDCVPLDIDARWILDVGANRGDVAVAGLRSFPKAQVICYEPVDETFEKLKQTLSGFPGRFHLHHKALGETAGEVEINLTNFHGANSILPQSKFHAHFNPHVHEIGKQKIQIVRLDDEAHQFPEVQIDVMKIDVEGFELPVLRGGSQFIPKNVDTIIIEISLMRDQSWEQQSIVDIFVTMKEMGFYLVNMTDLCHSTNSDMMLVQMDCVFRNHRMIKTRL